MEDLPFLFGYAPYTINSDNPLSNTQYFLRWRPLTILKSRVQLKDQSLENMIWGPLSNGSRFRFIPIEAGTHQIAISVTDGYGSSQKDTTLTFVVVAKSYPFPYSVTFDPIPIVNAIGKPVDLHWKIRPQQNTQPVRFWIRWQPITTLNSSMSNLFGNTIRPLEWWPLSTRYEDSIQFIPADSGVHKILIWFKDEFQGEQQISQTIESK